MSVRTPARDDARPVVVASEERFRQPRRRRRSRVPVLLVLLALSLVAATAWVLGWSGVLGVRTIEVDGGHRVSDRLAELTAQVTPGTPLARVDTGAVENRLRELRVVQDATVERVWPHTLRITLVERTAAAVVRRGDTLRLVDRDGIDFAQVTTRPRGLPFVDVDLATTDPAVVTTALDVLDGLPTDLRRRVVAVAARTTDDVRLRLRSGAVVLWGDASAGQQKAAVVQALLHHHADRYDVRAPLAPTTTG